MQVLSHEERHLFLSMHKWILLVLSEGERFPLLGTHKRGMQVLSQRENHEVHNTVGRVWFYSFSVSSVIFYSLFYCLVPLSPLLRPDCRSSLKQAGCCQILFTAIFLRDIFSLVS